MLWSPLFQLVSVVVSCGKAESKTPVYIGIVKTVSLNSIVFGNVLKLDARNATVQPMPSDYILTDPRNAPKLILGKFYFFNESTVFTDFIHGNVVELLYFIFIKCSP